MRRFFKISGILLGSVASLLLILILLVWLGAFNSLFVQIAVHSVNKDMTGELSVEKLEGNLFSHFQINNIQIQQSDTLIFSLDTLAIEYKIWSLFRKEVYIQQIMIQNGMLFLKQENDTIWNFETLFPPDSKETEKDTTQSNWIVDIQNLKINKVHARITTLDPDSKIPSQITLNTSSQLKLAGNELAVDLHHLSLNAEDPSFLISKLQGRASLKDSTFSWDGLVLKLEHSFIQSHGSIPLNSLNESSIQLNASPFDFKDLHPWLPALHGQPTIEVRVHSQNQMTYLDANIQAENQSIRMNGSLSDYYNRPSYQFSLTADSLNANYWTHRPDLNSNIHGTLRINGKGFDLESDSLLVFAEFKDLNYDRFELKQLLFNAEKKGGDLHANLNANTFFGKIVSNLEVANILKTPHYKADVHLKHLNLAPLTLNEKLTSSINLDMTVKGEGYQAGETRADVHIKSKNSKLFQQPISQFITHISVNKNEYLLNKFRLQTPYLDANFSGKSDLKASNILHFDVFVKNIEEIVSHFGFNPFSLESELHGNLSGPRDALKLDANVSIADLESDTINIGRASANIQSLFSLNSAQNINSDTSDIVQHIIQNGFISAQAEVNQLSIGLHQIDSLDFIATKEKSELNASAHIHTRFGNMDGDLAMNQIFNTPLYRLKTNIHHLDLSYVLLKPDLVSDLNLHLEASGEGFQAHNLNSNINFQGSESTLFDLPLKDFNAVFSISKGNYTLNGFDLKTPFASFVANGEGNWKLDNHFSINAHFEGDEKTPFLFGNRDVRLKGNIQAEVSGPIDSLHLLSQIDLEQFKFDSIQFESLAANADIRFEKGDYLGNVSLKLMNGGTEDFKLSHAEFQSSFDKEKAINIFMYQASDSVYGKIRSEVYYKNDPTLYLPEINLNYNQHQWLGGGNQSYIQFGKDSIHINEFSLASKESSIQAQGTFSFQGKEDLHLKIKNLHLSGLPGTHRIPYSVGGIADLALDLTGTANSPDLYGFVNIEMPTIDTLSFRKLYTQVNYTNDVVSMEAFLNGHAGRLINAEMMLPFQFSLSNSVYLPKKDTPLTASISINQLDLGQVNPFIPIEDTRTGGLLNMNMKLSNTINAPNFKGAITIQDGFIRHTPLGIDYHSIMLKSRMDSTVFLLDSTRILAGKGRIDMNGSLRLLTIDQKQESQLDFNLTGKNFKAFDSDMLRATINPKLRIKGPLEAPAFDGQLTVIRSTLNSDLFVKRYNRVYDDSDLPMLIAAQEKKGYRVNTELMLSDTIQKNSPTIFKHFTGEFDVIVPRNTWVKGKNMNFELAGALKAIKKGEQIDVFGTMNVKRGYYKIYGRRLEFEEGEVTFTGGQTLDPIINFTITYGFRDTEDVLRNLLVMISGKSSNPSIKFSLDESAIEEKDAISYLLFNKSLNELNNNEQTRVSSNMSVAKDIALGQVSAVLKNALQSSLGLDVIEISGKSGWSQGNVSIGKYITNNLFLSYERAFTLDKRDKLIDPEKITLEYQLYRSLFIQATNQRSNSGFDILLKRTWR